MKKTLLLISLFTCILSVNAQNIGLKTINPEPRVGQSISITLDLDFIKDYIKETLPSGTELTGFSLFSKYSYDILVSDTGNFQIGPYEFEFNDKKYQTDSIILHVIPTLEKKEGIWIRLIEYDSTQFLIVEQYLENQWEKNKKSKAKSSKSLRTSDLKFAALIEKPIDGLYFYQRQSTRNSVFVDDKNPFGASLGYSRQIYRVSNETGKEIVLTKKFFEHLPKKVKIPKIKIGTTKKPPQKI